jgi:hypothetical protein
MKKRLSILAAAGLIAAFATTVHALPYNARGTFNDWGETPLNDDGDGTHSVTIGGLTAGTIYEFKIAENDWANNWPSGDNAKVVADPAGSITLHFRPDVTLDGWHPQAARIGYDDPGHGWEVMGSFNGWASDPVVTLTNQGNGLFEGAYVVATPGTYQFKFRKAGDWDIQYGAGQFNGSGDLQVITTEPNQSLTFRLDLPNGRWLAGDPLPASTNQVTFLVDMGVPIQEFPAPSGFDTNTTGDILYVRGSFNGWATQSEYQLFQVGASSLYSNTVEIVAYAGTVIQYKFFGDSFPGEETPLLSCNDVRSLTISGPEVTAPLAYWSDRSLSDPTNHITFQVDMSVQQAVGGFDPSTDQVFLRGSFNNWSDPIPLASLPDPDTNIYAGTIELPNWPIGACIKYKFFNNHAGAPNGGWESINDRQFNIASPDQVVPPSAFNNIEICDVLEVTNFITFTVSMTNAVATDATVYDGTQSVYLNGDFLNWWAWDNIGAATAYQMTQVPGTSNYTLTLPMPPGNNLRIEYKYSMNTADNEAGFALNHERYIRTVDGQTEYTLPLDLWTGTDTNRIANLEEPKFGYLKAIPGSSGQVQIEWLGLKCVSLQTTTNLTSGWLTHPASAGSSGTNWPADGDQVFFRLVDPNP